VQGTEAELKTAVTRCAGHAFSLTLLASLAYETSSKPHAPFEKYITLDW